MNVTPENVTRLSIKLLLALTFLSVNTYFNSYVDAGDKSHGKHHHHQKFEVTNTNLAPKIDIKVTKDSMSGWNLYIQTKNFSFTPEKVNQEHVLGQGHAHLYIDGKKISRLYGPWYHLSNLTSGKHTIQVTLNTNQHGVYAIAGKEIAAEVIIKQ